MNRIGLLILFMLWTAVLPWRSYGQSEPANAADSSKQESIMEKWHGIVTFQWQGLTWIGQPQWGITHPQRPVWYDSEMVFVDDSNCVVVDLHENRREIKHSNTILVRRWETGYCRTVEEFKYGTFEWEARMPYGTNLWPALWLASDSAWPPEIDCVEGWSNNNPRYNKGLFFKNMRPTMHWMEKGERRAEHRYNIRRGWINKMDEYTTYKVVWTPEYVDIFYNDNLVKRFDNPYLLEQLNQPGLKMHPIMSMNVQSRFDDKDYKTYREAQKPFSIKSFKYVPWSKP